LAAEGCSRVQNEEERGGGSQVGQTIMGFVKELVYGPKSKLNTGASI
jgi:hypothetical protein